MRLFGYQQLITSMGAEGQLCHRMHTALGFVSERLWRRHLLFIPSLKIFKAGCPHRSGEPCLRNQIPRVTGMNDASVGGCICTADWEVRNRATMRQISTGNRIVLNKSTSFFRLGTNWAQLAISELKQKPEFCWLRQNTGPPWLSTQARDNSSFR